MKQVFNHIPSEGLTALFPEFPDEKYLINPGYIMVELKQGDIYLTFYIRSMGQAGYVVYMCLPEFEKLRLMKYNKPALLKLMSESELIALTIKNSTAPTPDQGAPMIQEIKDFSLPEGKTGHAWVLKETIPVPFSKNAFIEGTNENKYLTSVLNEMFRISDDFLGACNKLRTDYTVADWNIHYRPKLVDSTIRRCLKDNYLPPFIVQVETIGNEGFRNALREEKILVCSEGVVTCGYGSDIDEEHRNLPYTVLIMTEVFDPATKDLDICFMVHLKPDGDRQIAYLDLGSAQEMGSKLLNETDRSTKGKISPQAFKYMNRSAYIYFHANKDNTGYSLEEYVKTGKRVESFDDRDEKNYHFDGSKLVVNFYSYFRMEDIWERFHTISVLIGTGLTIIREILDYTPVYINSFGLHVFNRLVDGMTFFFNPVAKIRKWTSKDFSFKQ